MPSVVSRPPPTAPGSALAAFLRGIERRAYVLALAQCGQPGLARAALAQALRAFSQVAASTPLPAWPSSFWSLLLAQDELSQGEAGVPELSALSSGPRAALLLRLVAGLDFGHAAQVLGVSESAYRYASQRALQQLGEAGVSYAALAAVRERLHRQIKALPEIEIEALAETRQQAMQAPVIEPALPERERSRWPLWGLGLLALAFAATWWPQAAPPLAPGRPQGLAEAPPPPTPPSEADRISHPDYPLLAAPEALARANRLALLSWWAATAGPAEAAPAAPVATPPPAAPSPSTLPNSPPAVLAPLRSSWSRLDSETRHGLMANARHWATLDSRARQALVARMQAWDARPASERAAQRAAFLAWQRLPVEEQAELVARDRAWLALPQSERERLQGEFAALDEDQQQDWWLGPRAGAGFAALRPLFAYVPEGEREGLIEMLRGLSTAARNDLAVLAARLPAETREQLRQDLLALPIEQREAWIRERLQAPPLPSAGTLRS